MRVLLLAIEEVALDELNDAFVAHVLEGTNEGEPPGRTVQPVGNLEF